MNERRVSLIPTKGLISWSLYDWANQSFPTVIQTFIFAAYFTRRIAENQTVGSAQWGNAISLAGLVVALGGPALGAIADQKGRRKPWIGLFTLLCVISMACMWFVRPLQSGIWPALILVGAGTVTSEYAMIFYNAMLPSLVNSRRMGRWSGIGWSLGYAGGLVCLAVALLAFVTANQPWLGLDRESAQHVRATFLLAAAWYLLFSLPLFLFTPDTRSTGKSMRRALRDGLGQLADSARNVRRYKNIVKFLIVRMVYIDALATVFAFGGVYAAGTFDMDEQGVLVFGICLNVTAGAGAALFSWIDDKIGSKRTIMLSLLGLILSGTTILLVHSLFLFWTFGLILGLFVGPVQASSRSFLGRAAPRDLQNQMFGLYAFSGKATSFVGPFLVGWLTYIAKSQRIGMSAIMVLFLIGAIGMFFVSDPEDRKMSSLRHDFQHSK
jgi:UMF1 family MFS transporter